MRQGFLRRTVATGQQQVFEVSEALAISTINIQQFAAPMATIRAKPDTIRRQSDQRSRMAMLGGDTGDMRLVHHGKTGNGPFRRKPYGSARRKAKSGCRSCATRSGCTSSMVNKCASVSS